jgi:hypothetical protein
VTVTHQPARTFSAMGVEPAICRLLQIRVGQSIQKSAVEDDPIRQAAAGG